MSTKRIKPILTTLALAIVIVALSAVLPVRTEPQPATATEPIGECPPPTDRGVYFIRGIDKDGNVACGFAYFNPCPYFEGAEAGTPECEKGKPTPEQMQRWYPDEDDAEQTTIEQPIISPGGK